MRIVLLTCGLTYGGAERIVECLALGLSEMGDDVCVVATTRDGPIGNNLRGAGIPVHVLDLASIVDVRAPLRLAHVLTQFKADLVHSHLAVADIISATTTRFFRGLSTISTVHNPGVELSPLKRRLWRHALKRLDKVIAVSEHTKHALLTETRTASEVQYPSVVPLAPRKHFTREEARRELGVPNDAFVILGLGRLAPIKGFDVLAKTASALRSVPDVRIVVVGDGPERSALEAQGLELRPARNDAADLIVGADVVVCPSRSEGFPQTPLQALGAGVPVVATRTGGLPEVVADEVSGLLVAPNDPEALGRALLGLASDRPRTRVLGEAGRRLVQERGLTRESMTRRTRETYAMLLGGRESST